MPCFHPVKAWLITDYSVPSGQKFRRRLVFFNPVLGNSRLSNSESVVRQPVPCGQCVGCRLERSRQWAVRCLHEASLYERNCFITLTYNNDFLPDDRSLHYVDFQKFMKRLRKRFKGHRILSDGTAPIRFYMAGEYGENYGRPHYHACIFNFDFMDKYHYLTSPSGSKVFRSPSLEELWTDPASGQSLGFSSIGAVNFNSAAYVARYIMKKINGDLADDHYFDSSTGVYRTPEFNKMSLKPGIGAGWFDQFKSDVFAVGDDGTVYNDFVVVKGKRFKPPKFYDRRFKDEFPVEFDVISKFRVVNAQKQLDDNTPERLKAKEDVTNARLNLLKRNKVD